MTVFEITEAGNYQVWATPLDVNASISIVAVDPAGTRRTVAAWIGTVPPVATAGEPRATAGELAVDEHGVTVHTEPAEARLIVRSLPHLLTVVYDSHPTGG